jgi:hypothetical protein
MEFAVKPGSSGIVKVAGHGDGGTTGMLVRGDRREASWRMQWCRQLYASDCSDL